MKYYCCEKTNYRVIQDYGNPSKIRMHRKMETDWAQKIYKNQLKILPHILTLKKEKITI